MRNELQAAVRYFEMLWEGKTDFEALAMCDRREMERAALSALRDALQRQPDPDTGLVPCGCGGFARVAVRYAFPDERRVYCERCGVTTDWLSAPISVLQFHWNRAMGWGEQE